MPPKKRTRAAAASQTPPDSSPAPAPPSAFAPDSWSPSEESALFQAIVKSKPTGIHKHMHMLTVAQSIRDAHNALHPLSNNAPIHLGSRGIWAKLASLYDLAALDEREESYRLSGPRFRRGRDGVARQVDSSDDSDGDGHQDNKWEAFSLLGSKLSATSTGDVVVDTVQREDDLISVIKDHQGQEADFASMMWQRRLAGADDASEENSSSEEADSIDDNADDENEERDEDVAESREQAPNSRPTAARRDTRRTRALRRESRASAIADSEDAMDDNDNDEDGEDDHDNDSQDVQDPSSSSSHSRKVRSTASNTRRSGRKR